MGSASSTSFYIGDFSYSSRPENILISKLGSPKDYKVAKRIDYKLRKRELEIIADIKPHKNVVQIFGLLYGKSSDKQPIGYVMEHMYASLEEVIFSKSEGATNNRQMPSYSSEKAIKMAIEICDGIDFLHHANIIHRDIKPSNILVSSDLAEVKLCDFGVSAKYVDERSLTAAQGTYMYMAPELYAVTDRTKYTKSCDIYSIAITLYELLLKRRAYPDDLGKSLLFWFTAIAKGKRPSFPDTSLCWITKHVIEQCWSGNPAERPSIFVIRSHLLLALQLISATSPFDDVTTKCCSDQLRKLEQLKLERVNVECSSEELHTFECYRKNADSLILALKSPEYNQRSPEQLFDKLNKDDYALTQLMISISEGDYCSDDREKQEYDSLQASIKTAIVSLGYLKLDVRRKLQCMCTEQIIVSAKTLIMKALCLADDINADPSYYRLGGPVCLTHLFALYRGLNSRVHRLFVESLREAIAASSELATNLALRKVEIALDELTESTNEILAKERRNTESNKDVGPLSNRIDMIHYLFDPTDELPKLISTVIHKYPPLENTMLLDKNAVKKILDYAKEIEQLHDEWVGVRCDIQHEMTQRSYIKQFYNLMEDLKSMFLDNHTQIIRKTEKDLENDSPNCIRFTEVLNRLLDFKYSQLQCTKALRSYQESVTSCIKQIIAEQIHEIYQKCLKNPRQRHFCVIQ